MKGCEKRKSTFYHFTIYHSTILHAILHPREEDPKREGGRKISVRLNTSPMTRSLAHQFPVIIEANEREDERELNWGWESGKTETVEEAHFSLRYSSVFWDTLNCISTKRMPIINTEELMRRRRKVANFFLPLLPSLTEKQSPELFSASRGLFELFVLHILSTLFSNPIITGTKRALSLSQFQFPGKNLFSSSESPPLF